VGERLELIRKRETVVESKLPLARCTAYQVNDPAIIENNSVYMYDFPTLSASPNLLEYSLKRI
jgi:hypothetical protein